jgi:HrpA-like RNA helicase
MNYKEMKKSYLDRAIETVKTIHLEEGEGDILVFLTGQQEIESGIRSLGEAFREGVELIPIYSSLESLEQNRVFEEVKGKRKIILSTNIAQTSVTVPNIRFVVDSGFVKQKMYDPQTHMDALVVTPISQAAATQRAGRAGRTMNGKVFRLYSKEFFETMDHDTVPEIQRSSLIGTVLTLKKMGFHDVLNFEFIDPPEPDLILAAVKDLFLLGAVDQDGHLTHLGIQIADFPISPFLSRALISSSVDFHCSFEFLTIAAMLSVEDVFVSMRSKKKQAVADHIKKKFHHPTGDHLTLLNVYQAWKDNDCSKDWCFDHFIHYRAIRNADRVRSQLLDIMNRLRLHIHHCARTKRDTVDPIPILKALSTAFYVHAGKKHPQRPYYYPYLSVAGNHEALSSNMLALYIGPQSSLFSESPDWVLYNDIQFVNRAQMRVVSRIDFSMVSVLLGRVKLMDLAKLAGTSSATNLQRPDNNTQSGIPQWAENEVSEEIGPSHDSSQDNVNHLKFEKVEEYIDELHKKEIIHTRDGDFEFDHSVSPNSKRREQELEQEKERDRKRDEYRQRYLKRKKS